MIRLKKMNIVKEVASELAAKKLEQLGYKRVEEMTIDIEIDDSLTKKQKETGKKKVRGKEDDAGSSTADHSGGTEQADSDGGHGQS